MRNVEDQDAPFMQLVMAIAGADADATTKLLVARPELARRKATVGASRHSSHEYFLELIEHHLYAGDTALHVAAAAYAEEMASQLIVAGADICAKNRHGQEPLHYAVLGNPGSRRWNPGAQAAAVGFLLKSGADPNCTDRGGVTPLHRAVRTRCAAAVRTLLEGGADPRQTSKAGSTAFGLAQWTTGRGGSGTPEAKAQQQEILELLRKATNSS